jgi:hypothetical protein
MLFLCDFLPLIQPLKNFDGGHCYIFSEKPFVELKSKAEEKAKMYYLYGFQ